MRRTLLLVAAIVLVVVAVALVVVRGAHEDATKGSGTAAERPIATHGAANAATAVRIARRRVTAPAQLPRAPQAARTIAARYAVAAYTKVAGELTNRWVTIVAPLCTAAWRSHLDAADSATTAARTTARPRVEHLFSSAAPVGAVGVTVVVRVNEVFESLYVELRDVGGRYLVAATQ